MAPYTARPTPPAAMMPPPVPPMMRPPTKAAAPPIMNPRPVPEPFAAAAGAVAFCYEVIFTRMLSHVLGGSIFAFATMLAGFLLGIALGGTLFATYLLVILA